MGDAAKSLAAEIEAVTERERTRLIAWLAEHQVSTATTIDREMTADALMADFIAPRLTEIAALQSRAFEDGARWRRTGKMSRPAFGSGGTDEWFRPSDGLLRDFQIGFEPNLGVYYGLTIDFAPSRAALAEQEKSDA